MPLPVLTDLDLGGIAKVTGLQPGTAATDAVTKAQLDAAVEGLAWKDSARVATSANVSLASPGASVDGVTMAVGDRVLVRAQTAPAENGIYVWNGAAVAMARALDANGFDELESAVISVEEGTSAGATFRQSAVNGTLGSTAVTWGSFGTGAPAASDTTAGIAELATQAEVDAGTVANMIVTPQTLANWAGRARRFQQTFGDGSATAFVLTHNLGTRDLDVAVAQTGGTFDRVLCEVEFTSVNSVTVRVNAAPAAGALRATILG